MKNNKEQAGLDLLTPFIELITLLVSSLAILVKELIVIWIKRLGFFKNNIEKQDFNLLKVKKKTFDPESIGIELSSKRALKLSEIDYRLHSFVVGGSGFGKTNLISILQEYSLVKNKPIIFIDPKGDTESLQTFIQICKLNNRSYKIFSEHHRESIKLNPILDGSVTHITDRIMDSFEWSESFYKDCARSSLTRALDKLKKLDTEINFTNLLAELRNKEDKNIIGLINKIEAICISDFGAVINGGKVDYTLNRIREEKLCLYIGLSVLGYPEIAKAIGKLFLNELKHQAYETLKSLDLKKGLNNPISVYFDEFGSIAVVNFIDLLNKCRKAGIEITTAVQTIADIDSVNPTLATQILENSCNFFIFKQRLDISASLFSEAIGTTTTKKYTRVVENNREVDSGSVREANELIVHPDIIKNLNIGQCVLLQQGPTRVRIINVRERIINEVEGGEKEFVVVNEVKKEKKEEAFNKENQ